MSEAPSSSDERCRSGWVAFTTAAVWVIFLQSVTAGRILSGDGWARTTHRATGVLLFLGVLGAGLAALAASRTRPEHRRLGLSFVGLAVCLYVQVHLGSAAAEGKETLWLHVPFGVAIVVFAVHTHLLARRLHPSRAH